MSGRHFIHLSDADKLAKMRKRYPTMAAAVVSMIDGIWATMLKQERAERAETIMAAARGERAPRRKR